MHYSTPLRSRTPLPSWIDRDDRKPASIAGFLTVTDGRKIPVTITNLSSVGCRVECDETLPIAQTVRLNVRDKSVDCHVRWALPGVAGLRFQA